MQNPSIPNKQGLYTKDQLRHALLSGKTLSDLLSFSPGQECEIYKAPAFYPDNTVLYIPDIDLNEIPIAQPITDPEKLQEVLAYCYTGEDFLTEANGDKDAAKDLFMYVDWQNPSSAWPEVQGDRFENSSPLEQAKALIQEFCWSEYHSDADFSNLAEIGIAYTTLTDDELPIQVNVDLTKFRISRLIDYKLTLPVSQYRSLEDMIENALKYLDFSDLIYVSEEEWALISSAGIP